MRRYSTQFERLAVGASFTKGGNKYVKKSTRTAYINEPGEAWHEKWFYFGRNESVVIAR